jgi:hypothetical protein
MTPLPFDIGHACFQMLIPQGAAPAAVWNGMGKEDQLGASRYFDGASIPNPGRAPDIFLFLPAGDPTYLPAGTTVTFQGLIVDFNSSSSKGVSTTNAVVLTVM